MQLITHSKCHVNPPTHIGIGCGIRSFRTRGMAASLASYGVLRFLRTAKEVVNGLESSAKQLRIPRLRAMATEESGATAPHKIKLALCQMLVTEDKRQNIANAEKAVKDAADHGSDVVVLPEMWNCPYSNDSFPTYAEQIPARMSELKESPSVQMMSDISKQCGVNLVGGSIPERSNGKLFNTCCVFGRDGSLLAKHRKVHLFDIDIPGKITFRESDTLTGGGELTTVDTDVGRLGIGICYDIRFQEMAMIYAQRGVDLIIYPGAFNMTTGPVHWELLAKARAVDNQLFVATCSPARNKNSNYQAWGHSTIVGPFAEIIGKCDHTEATVHGELDLSQTDMRRRNMPLASQRRSDLYGVVDKKPPL